MKFEWRLLGPDETIGDVINPINVEGQIEGGSSMGCGLGLTEIVQMKGGKVQNPDLASHLLPTSLDAPGRSASIIVESAEPRGPFGAKGAAEPAVNPTAPAIKWTDKVY